MNKKQLQKSCLEWLLDGIVPFWAKHGLDTKYGGVLSCMDEYGRVQSGDKYIWSQARWVWTSSALYNRVEKRPEFLTWAKSTIDFLLAHGRDDRGRWVYHTNQQGEVIEGATSIYSDCFAVYGLSEYHRAARGDGLLAVARETFAAIQQRIESPSFSETAPYPLPPNRRNHGVPMILTEVAGELARTTGDAEIARAADVHAGNVMNHFVRPARRCLLEFLDRNYQEVPAPEGTYIMPGHAIESMWFVMHRALARKDTATIRAAAEVLRWHLEKGWDPEYGGIFLGIDAEGHPPYLPHADTKVWWPHTEALYALLLAETLTGERWCETWFDRVYEWTMHHFPMTETGEWRQRLNRAGEPMTTIVALPVKDPFHLPRALILSLELLRRP